jgi:type 1 glutamine amidotransferase
MRGIAIILSVGALVIGATGAVADGGAVAQEAKPVRAALWVGGFAHEFDAYAEIMTGFLTAGVPLDGDDGPRVPVEVRVVRDGAFLEDPAYDDLDVLIMDHCFESVDGVLTPSQQGALLSRIRLGLDVVAVHASYYSFVAWPEVRELYGATFTTHGSSEVDIEVRQVRGPHPIFRGVPKSFVVKSELYQSTPLADDCILLAVAHEVGTAAEYPSVWVRPYGAGRVVTILPAHWPEAYQVPAFQRLIGNSVLFAAGRLPDPDKEATP